MPGTTGFQAALEANNTQFSYGVESAWGTAPATVFNALRYTGETLSGSKSRQRPQEILVSGEASAAITVQETAGGALNFALSYATYDDLISSLLGNDFQAPQTIAGIAGDIVLTSGTNVLSSSLATKFQNITQGSWIRLFGFTNAANNGFFRVMTKTDNSHLVLAGPTTIVTETPAGTAAQVRASTILNGTQFKSLFLQQKFASNLWLQYPGSFVSGMTLTGSTGQFLSGSFNIVSKVEVSAVADASTGGVTAAPSGNVHDPVGGFGGVLWNQAAFSSAVDSFTINIQRQGASPEFAMGSAAAAGMMMGTMTVSGSLKLFFKDFTDYAKFKSETAGSVAVITKDSAGNAYVITLPVATIMNPKIDPNGPGTMIYASFDLEGNPQATGGTIQFDKLPAT